MDKTTAPSWFDDSLFNLLVDYYTEIPGRPYGSGATRENVLPVLRDLQLGFIAVYAKGHSGRTSFKSTLRTEHVMLDKEMPAFWREVTRETGTKLILYYSGLLDGVAALRHPEWQMMSREGEPVTHMDEIYLMHAICPQSGYFDEWVRIHFEEMFASAQPDGIWIDGDWRGPCYCERCFGRFRKETGHDGPMPWIGDETPIALAWRKTWSDITQEWRTKMNDLVKSLNPECLFSVGNISPRREYSTEFDWRSGDWFSPSNHRLMQSLSMRYYTTHDIPYDAMTCDTSYIHAWNHQRSRSKTLPRMLQEGAGVLANGAQWCYWTYPMPDGAFVPSKMRTAKACAEFARERREVCLHNQSLRWTAVLDAEPRAHQPLLGKKIQGAGKALIALHRSPDLMDESTLSDSMPYDLIVVPEQPVLTAETVGKLERWVGKGGKLLTTGASIHSLELQKLLGVRLVQRGVLGDGHTLLQNRNPAGVFAAWDEVEVTEAEELYPLYRSWDAFNPEMRFFPDNYPITGMVDEENPEPAGFPAATLRRLGKGMAVHIPSELFATYWDNGYPDILAWLREILGVLQPEPIFQTDALSFVEISLRRKDDTLLVHFVNGNPGRDLSAVRTNDLWVDDIPAVGSITCWLRCENKPQKVTIEPGGIVAETEWSDGVLKAVLPRLEIHSCFKIAGWKQDSFSEKGAELHRSAEL